MSESEMFKSIFGDAIKDKLSELPYVYYAGISSEATGVFSIIPVANADWQKYEVYFDALEEITKDMGRNATVTYGTESVLTANIVKEEKMEIIRDLYSDSNSAREIARELDISHTQVNRLLKEMFTDGTLNKRGTGTVPKVTGVPNVPFH